MLLGTFRRVMHECLPDFLIVTVAKLLEIGFAALAVIALVAIVKLCS